MRPNNSGNKEKLSSKLLMEGQLLIYGFIHDDVNNFLTKTAADNN